MKNNFLKISLLALVTSAPLAHAVVQSGCSADYIIVGNGTAGAALAAKLSDPVNGAYVNSVLVLEVGINRDNDPAVLGSNIFDTIPLTWDPKYSRTTVAYTYDPEGAVAPYTDGQLWGGSSAHNGLQAYRGTAAYDQWATISGNPEWSYNNLLQNVFLPMEHYTPNGTVADPAQRGLTGPLFITQEPPLDSDAFMQAVRFGTVPTTPFVSDLNNPSLGVVGVGAGQDYVTPPFLGANSIRSFSSNSYLTGIPAINTGGAPIPAIVDADGNGLNGRKLKITSNAVVSRVLFNGTTAIGVEYILSDDRETVIQVYARKEVILSAGTIATAAILQRSGIGDAALLNSLGIPVVFANSNVGQHVLNHYGPAAVFTGGDPEVSTIPLPRFGFAFVDLAPAMSPGVRRYQILISNGTLFFNAGIAQALEIPPTGVTLSAVDVTPHSEGSVTIASADPFVSPRVDFNFYSDGLFTTPGTDAYKAVQFYRTYVKNVETALQADFPGAVVAYPTPAMYADNTNAQLFAAALNTFLVTYHAVGSARMSLTPATGVVDGNLRVHGVKNLRCADNSVVPVIEEGNTAYEAFVIGLELARIIRAGN